GTVRRLIRSADDDIISFPQVDPAGKNLAVILLLPRIVTPALFQELRAGDNGFDQAAESVILCGETSLHRRECLPVRRDQTASERVGEQLSAQVVDEVLLPLVPEVHVQPFQPRAVLAVWERCRGCYGTVAQVLEPPLADGAEALEDQADGIETAVARGTVLVGPMSCQHLRQRQLAQLRLVLG